MGRRKAISPLGDQETAEEARDRYYREESSALGGVFSPGGATAGGIFGEGQILTQEHDGPALRRHVEALRGAEHDRLSRQLSASRRREAKLLKRIEALEQRQLPGRSRGRDEDEDLDDEDDEDFDDEA